MHRSVDVKCGYPPCSDRAAGDAVHTNGGRVPLCNAHGAELTHLGRQARGWRWEPYQVAVDTETNMSVTMCSNEHLNRILRFADVLVKAGAIRWPALPVNEPGPAGTGAVLRQENVMSLVARYGHGYDPEAYVWQPEGRVPTPVEAFKLCRSYAYQSCEHPGYSDSAARAFIDEVREAARLLIREVATAAAPGLADRAFPGWDAAPWLA